MYHHVWQGTGQHVPHYHGKKAIPKFPSVIFATWVFNNGNEIIVTLTHSHSLVHVYTHHMLDVPCASHYIAREV